jgi:hypothetical protein
MKRLSGHQPSPTPYATVTFYSMGSLRNFSIFVERPNGIERAAIQGDETPHP